MVNIQDLGFGCSVGGVRDVHGGVGIDVGGTVVSDGGGVNC